MSQADAYIRHLVPEAYLRAQDRAQGYLPAGFSSEGFIHCTREPELLLQVANAVFREAPGDFRVLVIDPARVSAELRWEPPFPAPAAGSPLAGQLFPHIYGPLNWDAVVEIRRAERSPDGSFVSV